MIFYSSSRCWSAACWRGPCTALVALGFVLIYKASSVFNFAQGAMVFFAVLSFVGFMELGLPFWAALPVTVGC